MGKRNLFFLAITLIICVYSHSKAKSLTNIVPPDSVTTKVVDGRTFVIHEIDPHETWYSLSRRYGTDVRVIQAANPEEPTLIIGHRVLVPFSQKQATSKKQVVAASKPLPFEKKTNQRAENSKYHIVEKGQGLYGIAKTYHITVPQLRQWNHIQGNEISVGQRLIVNPGGRENIAANDNPPQEAVTFLEPVAQNDYSPKTENLPATQKEQKPETEVMFVKDSNEKKSQENSFSEGKAGNAKNVQMSNGRLEVPGEYREVSEKGIASWIDDADINPGKYYALHRRAPIGTIIKVTNTMSGNSVYVKVVGILPNTGDNENLIIKLSKAAAKKLDVLDAKFQSELVYTVRIENKH